MLRIISDWSDWWNFTLTDLTLTITRFDFSPTSPSNAETVNIWSDIRNAALNLIRRRGHKPRDAREAFAASKWTAIRLVMTS